MQWIEQMRQQLRPNQFLRMIENKWVMARRRTLLRDCRSKERGDRDCERVEFELSGDFISGR